MTTTPTTPGTAGSGIDREAVRRRSLRVVVVAQMFSGAGLGAGIAVGGLLAEDMIGGRGYAGVPAALFTLGSALAAWLVGELSQRAGRRPGLALGYAVGALGGAGTVAAAAIDDVPLLLVSLFLYGSGAATSLQARYAGADLAEPHRRARSISAVMVATTLGAVIGPNLLDATGAVAEAFGIRTLAGPFMLSTLAFAAGAVVVTVLLRPDPLVVARQLALDAAGGVPPDAEEPASASERRTVRLAATVMVVSQLVMLAIMTMTPVHLRDHGHGLTATGVVISLHIAAMFLPSPLTGYLADRYGRRNVIAASAAAFGAAGALAALAPTDTPVVIAVALILLGLGWNLGVIGGTALLTDAVPLARRARTQGRVDVSLALSGAAGGLGSGLVAAASGFAALSVLGGVVGLAILPVLLAARAAIPRRPAGHPV